MTTNHIQGDKVIRLAEGNPIAGHVAEQIKDIIYDRCLGMSMGEVIGVLEIIKLEIFNEQS